MKTRMFLGAVTLAMLTVPSVPAIAQSGGTIRGGVLEIFGNDRCPTNSDGEAIFVCRRLDERERYRVPSALRELAPSPDNESWAVRVTDNFAAQDTGIGSCSTVGPGGQSGCFVKEATRSRAIRKEVQSEEESLPLP